RRTNRHAIGGRAGQRNGAERRDEDTRGEDHVDAVRPAGCCDKRTQLIVRRASFERIEAELHAFGGQTRGMTNVRRDARAAGVHLTRCRQEPTHGRRAIIAAIHTDCPEESISSSPIEQPRGGAPRNRPKSSKPPLTRRTRSPVRMAKALSTFARSSMRATPTSPAQTGRRVSGSTAT